MPDKTLESVLLNRPVNIHQMNLPPGDPNDLSAIPERVLRGFLQGPFTEKTPGVNNEYPELAGALASLVPIGGVVGKLSGLFGKGAKTSEGVAAMERLPQELKGFRPTAHEFQLPPERPPLTVQEANKMLELQNHNLPLEGKK